jgi:hypothetical protein
MGRHVGGIDALCTSTWRKILAADRDMFGWMAVSVLVAASKVKILASHSRDFPVVV